MDGQDFEVPTAKAKSKIIREVVLDDQLNIEQTVGIMLDHFEKVIHEINGKARAMIVVPFRKTVLNSLTKLTNNL